jgi:hypothetical protein
MPDDQRNAAVTTPHDPETRLKEAFHAVAESAPADASPEDVERVWSAVAGELPVEERRQLVERTATEPSLAQAWRIAHELHQAQGGYGGATMPRSSSWWPAALMGIAATLILAAGVRVLYFDRTPADVYRDSGRFVIESQLATDATLPRDAFVLKWKPGPQGSRYLVRVTTEDLQVLMTAPELTAAELTVPSATLAPVPAGGRVLWQVVMSPPGGEAVSSQTFVTRVR